MFCHVRHAPPTFCRPVPAYRTSLALRSDPVRSSRRRPAARRGGTLFPRVSPVRPCAGAGGRIAAARLARLIARARRRAHLARPFPPGAFSAPSRSLSAETPKGGPGSRLSLLSFYTMPPNVKPIREQKMKTSEIFHEMPVEWRPGSTSCAPASFFVTPTPSSVTLDLPALAQAGAGATIGAAIFPCV